MKKSIIALTVAIGIILIGIVMLEFHEDKNPVQDDNIQNNKSVLEVGKYVTKLEPNTIPNFKEGEKFLYKWIHYSDPKNYAIAEFKVEGIQRFNKTNCQILIQNFTMYFNNNIHKQMVVKMCIDKNGNPLYVDIFDVEPFSLIQHEEGNNASELVEGLSFMGSSFYAPWMLGLAEGLKFKKNLTFIDLIKVSSYSNDTIKKTFVKRIANIEYVMNVEGIEYVNNIKCYKVQINGVMTTEGFIGVAPKMQMTYWIDVNKRIIIKAREYGNENLPIAEINKI